MKKLLILATLGFTLSANAAFVDGNDLLSSINGDQAARSRGYAYIAGVFDAYLGLGHCAPVSVSLNQVGDMTRIALTADPATRNLAADGLILKMLVRYWPCEKKGTSL